MITVQDAHIQIVYEADGLLFFIGNGCPTAFGEISDFVFSLSTTGIFSKDHTKDQEISVIVQITPLF
jgi:hypothetical protein